MNIAELRAVLCRVNQESRFVGQVFVGLSSCLGRVNIRIKHFLRRLSTFLSPHFNETLL
jgi:hypothetical protein